MGTIIHGYHSHEEDFSGYRGNHDDDGVYTAIKEYPDRGDYCFDPLGRDDEKYGEYGQDADQQWNENGLLCRSSDDIEAEFDEKCENDKEEENGGDEKEGEAIVGAKDECKQNGEEDDDEQVGFVCRDLHARFNGEHSGRKKESLLNYPTHLPFPVRTHHLSCHMPSVVLKSYRNNGRLIIIKEVKVQHCEYFHVVRSNGRLTLYLVKHDADAMPSPPS